MRIVNKHGMPIPEGVYARAGINDRSAPGVLPALELLIERELNGYEDAPFHVIGDTEIPSWVREGDAREALMPHGTCNVCALPVVFDGEWFISSDYFGKRPKPHKHEVA